MKSQTLCDAFFSIHFMALVLLVSSCGPFERSSDGKEVRKPKDQSKLGQICAAIVVDKPNKGPLHSLADLKDRFVVAHNQVRQRYGLNPLVWDDQIARYAQKWADYLKDNDSCLMKHRSIAGIQEGNNYGENLAWNWTSAATPSGVFVESPEFAVHGWSAECKDYDYSTTNCTKGEQCGHFTQVVWADSERVGCGVAICDGAKNSQGRGRAEVWVCNYDPSGNIIKIDKGGNRTALRPF